MGAFCSITADLLPESGIPEFVFHIRCFSWKDAMKLSHGVLRCLPSFCARFAFFIDLKERIPGRFSLL